MQRNEELFNNIPSQDDKFLEEFNAQIEKTLSDPDNDPEFSIDTLCKNLYIGRSTLFRKVEKITGKTPNEYIMNYRLERAAQLLKRNVGNVTEVGGLVGFDTPQYFARCFKEKFGQAPKAYQKNYLETPHLGTQVKLKNESDIKELDRELIHRQPLPKSEEIFNPRLETPQRNQVYDAIRNLYDSVTQALLDVALKNIPTPALIGKIQKAIDEYKEVTSRKGRYAINLLDLFDIEEKPIRKNALATMAVCLRADLIPCGQGYSQLRLGNFGETFNLCSSEPFFNQPIGLGPLCTGVLVAEDIAATAAHFAHEKNVTDLCFVFDFALLNPDTPVTKIPYEKIYTGVEILHRVHNPSSDWALVKLDRKVLNQEIAVLSKRKIFYEQPVYVIGHPCGLPLKFSPGAYAVDITASDFRVNLGIYSSNSGSPVFCAQTHELIGIVSRGKPADLRWTGNCWISLSYGDNPFELPGSQCTRAAEFSLLIPGDIVK
jgi:AraC-like DNA-binding protein